MEMIKRENNYRPAFYVVQFIELPFEGIADYVCVPHTWMIVRKASNELSAVAYPDEEDPCVTRDRAKSMERCNNEWKYYTAYAKYETDSYNDAEYWIAKRNDCGPSVEKELKTSDPEPKFSLNKKLRGAKRKQSSKSNDNTREPDKQLDGKRLKPDDAAQSSSAFVTDTNAEPGSSRQEQSMITQDNQPMESAQTGTTGSDSNCTSSSSQQKHEKLQESLPMQTQQELSMLSVDVGTPTLVIDDDEEVQPTSIKEQQVPCSQAISQFTKQPELIQKLQIPVAPSMGMASNNQGSNKDDVKNNEPTSHCLLSSKKMSAQLYSQIDKARRLIPTQEPVEREIRPMNITSNSAIAEQSPSNLMDPTGSLTTRPAQRQSQPSQQDSQRQPQKPKIRICISTKPKNNQPTPALQVTKETLSPILTQLQKSIRKALLTTNIQSLQNNQQFQGNHSEHALVNENHRSGINNTSQSDAWMEEETPSVHQEESSDSDTNTDPESISDHEMSADEAPVERTNNFYGTGIPSRSSSADRPIAAQNSTNHQTLPKAVLLQQMLDHFATLFTQMRTTLSYTSDMYNTLRSTAQDTAQIYKKLLGAVEEFNSAQNLASNSSSSSKQTEEVSQIPKENHFKIPARANSSNTNRCSKKVANNPLKKKHNSSWRFVLPPEYDPHDTKWTLKYRTNSPGLVELMPQSGVYVSSVDLKYCQQVSKDCKSLARRLLSVVFNRNALIVCLSITERAQVSDNVGSNTRPELDDHACSVLLNLVLDHGRQRNWNIDLQPILSTLHSNIQEIRFRYGVMVEC